MAHTNSTQSSARTMVDYLNNNYPYYMPPAPAPAPVYAPAPAYTPGKTWDWSSSSGAYGGHSSVDYSGHSSGDYSGQGDSGPREPVSIPRSCVMGVILLVPFVWAIAAAVQYNTPGVMLVMSYPCMLKGHDGGEFGEDNFVTCSGQVLTGGKSRPLLPTETTNNGKTCGCTTAGNQACCPAKYGCGQFGCEIDQYAHIDDESVEPGEFFKYRVYGLSETDVYGMSIGFGILIGLLLVGVICSKKTLRW
jgi:hypothetical protein